MNTEKEVGRATLAVVALDDLPGWLQEIWRERRFNAVKLSRSLLTADAVLTWAFLLWILHTLMVAGFFAWSPKRFPAHIELAWSLGTFFGYYALIGFIRRQTQKYAITLSGEYTDGKTKEGQQVVSERVYNEADDPPIARFAFRLRDYFGLPRRGLGQSCIVLSQFAFGLCYVVNYIKEVLLVPIPDPTSFPSTLWIFHLTVTLGGCLILLKNAGFLVDVRTLLLLAERALTAAGKLRKP